MSLNNEPNFKSINLFTATCIVVANMIGTGVFTSLGFQVVDIKSGFVILFLWLVGGIFALCGALAYGELGAAMPRNGGEYYYLSRIYHPVIGFLSGWVSVTVGFAAPIAVAAMSLGQYFTAVFPLFSPTAIALLVVIAVSLIHTRNLQFGSSFQYMFTLLKVLLILVLVFCGFYLAEPQKLGFLPSTTDVSAIFSSPFAVSLVYVIYSYSGWNAAVYLANEVEKPEKNVPRALITGTLIVMGLYLLLNLMFLYTTPLEQLAGKLEVGYIAANYIFGANGAKIIGLLISVGLISSISSMVLAGSRVSQVIGEDIGLFKLLAKKNAQGIPNYAILFQLCLVIVLLITSSFESVITYLGFTLTFSSFLTVLGVFVFRFKYSDIPSTYRTWGYPVTPIIFLVISLWMLVFIFSAKPLESLAGFLTLGLGLIIYFFAKRIS
ncbi:amino acid permease [Aetokthonos hydrillicola Thurmond2011]|jgi:APA family basic amino acid/polyamine antiporter|uniref:Amino acid permease n=1 Tax=Aetokthonos hydrillicola Thurmond2011 TaxID=2712845 RepID=A0AAP5I711_9CYAN|nr:amino acid permease [Aetokthonos hydrillicola]MBO3463347.1 amino acid permease [Aetokthonos hydrillicola CCALA 1050]MBW4589554.1 amino acid permease [Aetokthonos hydrillicola CCALA 1050]MDR9896021.1 amino acid permease [Aetokthonos hydrillicola Thurmond2011]